MVYWGCWASLQVLIGFSIRELLLLIFVLSESQQRYVDPTPTFPSQTGVGCWRRQDLVVQRLCRVAGVERKEFSLAAPISQLFLSSAPYPWASPSFQVPEELQGLAVALLALTRCARASPSWGRHVQLHLCSCPRRVMHP